MAGPAGATRASAVRPSLNAFSLIDHMTGSYHRGLHGAWYLNGGMSHIMGWAGRGNTFKTAASKAVSMRVAVRYQPEWFETYDSENSFGGIPRLQAFQQNIPEARHLDIPSLLEEGGSWNITDSSLELGDEWWKKYRDEMTNRRNIKEKDLLTTPFMELNGDSRKMPSPWLLDVDSFSGLRVNSVENMHDKANVGDSALNTEAMKSGAAKSQMMGQMPTVAAAAMYYMNLTAHAGDEIKMDMYAPSHKKLSGLKGDLKLKGVPENFTFLTNSCFIATSSGPLLDKNTKLPLFPHPDKPEVQGDTDLMVVRFEQLRGKGGPTGAFMDLIFSQREGLLVGLTEFYYLREYAGNYGMDVKGNNQGFTLHLYPEVFFTRKSVRKLLMEDPKFARAMAITAAMAYMHINWFDMDSAIKLPPADVYTKIKEAGYDWNEILSDTVEYWYFLEHADTVKKPTITAMTLLQMAAGNYVCKILKTHP